MASRTTGLRGDDDNHLIPDPEQPRSSNVQPGAQTQHQPSVWREDWLGPRPRDLDEPLVEDLKARRVDDGGRADFLSVGETRFQSEHVDDQVIVDVLPSPGCVLAATWLMSRIFVPSGRTTWESDLGSKVIGKKWHVPLQILVSVFDTTKLSVLAGRD